MPIAFILVALPPFRCFQNESGPVHLNRLWATFILNSGGRKERWHERGEVASQHVPKVLPQAVASQEALGMAGSREATDLGNLLFLFGEAQRRHSLEERPKK